MVRLVGETAPRKQPAKWPTIGFLGATKPSVQTQWTAAFVQRMRERGWIEGRTIANEYRWAEGRGERAAELAAELVRLKVDVIVTSGTATIIAAKQATSLTTIVFASVGEPTQRGHAATAESDVVDGARSQHRGAIARSCCPSGSEVGWSM